MKVKDRSEKTVITTGIIKPPESFVRALNCFTEFHNIHTLLTESRSDRRSRISSTTRDLQFDLSNNFLSQFIKLLLKSTYWSNMHEIDFYRCRSSKHTHHYFNFTFFRVNLIDHTIKIFKWSFFNLYRITDFKWNFGNLLTRYFFGLSQEFYALLLHEVPAVCYHQQNQSHSCRLRTACIVSFDNSISTRT